jgi:hypothetical protein
MKCRKHPLYKGLGKPSNNCIYCWKFYAENQERQISYLKNNLRKTRSNFRKTKKKQKEEIYFLKKELESTKKELLSCLEIISW